MEWILLLLISSLATGAIAYFLKEDKKIQEKDQNLKEEKPEGPSSSPALPEAKQKIQFRIDSTDLKKFKDWIQKAPDSIEPQVKETDDLKKTIEEIKHEIHKKRKPLKVTYSTDEIIPRSSPFSRHRRPLRNAEKFVEEQKAKEALSIYERLEKRIPDEEIKQKIRTNIEDIRKWLLGLDEDEEPIEFPEIIIPLKTQTVALEKFNEGLKKISEDIAKEIANILSEGIKEIKADLSLSGNEIQAKSLKVEEAHIQDQKFLESPKIQKDSSILSDSSEQKIQEDFTKESKIPSEPIEPKEISRQQPEEATSDHQAISKETQKPQKISEREAISSNAFNGNLYFITPSFLKQIPKTIQKQKGIAQIQFSPIYLPTGPKVPTRPQEYLENILSREGFQFDSEGNLITDGWTDKDFEREWEKYKHLPLIDRRSGVERRKHFEYDPSKPDRRSGKDRRQIDLFAEREKFLEKYQKHLERKQLLEDQKDFFNYHIPEKIEESQLSKDLIIPILPSEDLEEIHLPEAKTEQIEKKSELLPPIEINVEPIEESISNLEDQEKEQELLEVIKQADYIANSLEELILNSNEQNNEQEKDPLSEPSLEESIDTREKQELETLNINVEPIEDFQPQEESIKSDTKDQSDLLLEELNLPESETNDSILDLQLPDSFFETEEEKDQEEVDARVELVQKSLNVLDLPESQSEEIPIEEMDSTPTSKVEIVEQKLEELGLPEPEEFQETTQKDEESEKEEDITDSMQQQELGEGVEEIDFPQTPENESQGPVQEIRGVLELKPPDEDDAPFLTLTYDFSKIPDSFQLSKDYHTLEYVYYKYKPLLIKAQEFARRKMLKNALNYYRMIKSQNIPPEFKRMINRNIQDITDYIEKFMMSRTES